MRLLKRDGAGDVSFTKDLSEPELPAYRYAILSHRWGPQEEEITYEDIAGGLGIQKPGIGSEKIRFCVEQTKQDGLEYFWVDTCCVDKRNNTELSEAINAMFRWYSRADRCYAYLAYVSIESSEGRPDWEHKLRRSSWFKRGWTLQELIAPPSVQFFSSTGELIGTRSSLEKHIHDITHIPIKVLRGSSLTDFTIHERRLWQQGRETTKPEDMVYSLLGLLEVSLPAIYGIGKDEAQRKLDIELVNKHKGGRLHLYQAQTKPSFRAVLTSLPGARREDFSLNFSLPGVVPANQFVARKHELLEMRENLNGDGSRLYLVLQGLGGIGKTQLAIAYAIRHKDDYTAIFWIDATSRDTVKSSFVRLSKQIVHADVTASGLAHLNPETDIDGIVDAVKAWLSLPMNNRWLLIYDNHDSAKAPGITDPAAFDLRQYFPDAYQGAIIITTRLFRVQFGHCMRIKKLELDDSLEILEQSSGRERLADDDDAVRLAQKLDGLPLALATAGAYLRQISMEFERYLFFWEQSWAALQKDSPAVISYEERTLFTTWQLSFEQIERRDSRSANLLRLWAYFDNQDLWFELLKRGKEGHIEWLRHVVHDELTFHACMRVLCDHGLVEANIRNDYGVESRGYSVHTCVHSWMLAVLNIRNDERLQKTAIVCVASHVPHYYGTNGTLLRRRLLSHADRCSAYFETNRCDDLDLADACHQLGRLYIRVPGRLSTTEGMFMQSLRHKKAALGPDHHSTLETTRRIASVYRAQGRMREAEEMGIQVLNGLERDLGLEHITTLQAVHSLGVLYRKTGKGADAEKMYLRALKAREKQLGSSHSATLSVMHGLGKAYRQQGKLDDAERMFERASRGAETALGPLNLLTFRSARSLGMVYIEVGKLSEAEEMLNRAFQAMKKVLGADDPWTLETASRLSALYRHQGKITEAEQLPAGLQMAMTLREAMAFDTAID